MLLLVGLAGEAGTEPVPDGVVFLPPGESIGIGWRLGWVGG